MSIRLRLLISYAAMLLIPLVMLIITAILLVILFRGDFQSIQEQYGPDKAAFENHGVMRMTKELWRTANKNPSLLEDADYLSDIAREFETNKSGLLVRKEDRFTYISPAWAEKSDFLALLPAFHSPGHMEKKEDVRYNNQILDVTQYDYVDAANQRSSISIVTVVNPFARFAQKFFPALFNTAVIILILTHTLLTYFVSRSIIRPLQKLKNAMKRMQAGDLEYPVQITSRDEIGQLGLAFEQMRRQLQESIQTQLQYEENRKELISNISHDLRTPLTAIRGYIAGLGDGIADTPEKRRKYIDIISSKADEMDRLIDELFLYSKLDLKQLPFNFEAVGFREFLSGWAGDLEFELGKQSIHFDMEMTLDDEITVMIDRDKIRRVFSNIVDNCLKYMNKPEKQVRLKVFRNGERVVIEIYDNGMGIDEEALPHIFDRFYRADPSRNSHTGGSGLGLAISKQMVEGHGGSIQARSVKGEGTWITMRFPLRTDKEGDK
ncbi:sensor histidine kinase [Paenibacillus sp. y28]|uniref:sensor histidine kinase n=1 Tax=Paenibacillus sp. y28 TaxID=3129110 RepID=UPI003018B93E